MTDVASESSDEQAWLDWRRGGIGASDVAAAWTGRYGGAYSVVADKLGIGTKDIDPVDAARGNRWETAIADGVHALTGYYVHAEQLPVSSPEVPHWLSTIDGLLDPEPETTLDDAAAVLEVKTSRQYVTPKWDYYKAQTNWQMLVTGKQRVLIAVAIIGLDLDGNETVKDLKLEWSERDDYLISQLIDLAEKLWAHVQAGTLPEPDEFTDLADVKAVNAEADTDLAIALDDDAAVMEYTYLKEAAKAAEKAYRDAEANLRHALGAATRGVAPSFEVRIGAPANKFTRDSEAAALMLHPEFGKTVLDRARFKAEQPEAYDELRVPSHDRRITVKEIETT